MSRWRQWFSAKITQAELGSNSSWFLNQTCSVRPCTVGIKETRGMQLVWWSECECSLLFQTLKKPSHSRKQSARHIKRYYTGYIITTIRYTSHKKKSIIVCTTISLFTKCTKVLWSMPHCSLTIFDLMNMHIWNYLSAQVATCQWIVI